MVECLDRVDDFLDRTVQCLDRMVECLNNKVLPTPAELLTPEPLSSEFGTFETVKPRFWP